MSERDRWLDSIFVWILDDGISTLFNYYPLVCVFVCMCMCLFFSLSVCSFRMEFNLLSRSECDIELWRLMAECFNCTSQPPVTWIFNKLQLICGGFVEWRNSILFRHCHPIVHSKFSIYMQHFHLNAKMNMNPAYFLLLVLLLLVSYFFKWMFYTSSHKMRFPFHSHNRNEFVFRGTTIVVHLRDFEFFIEYGWSPFNHQFPLITMPFFISRKMHIKKHRNIL